MSNIQIFNFNSNQVRLQIIHNKEYFCAKDVCDILELANVGQATSRIEKDDIILNDTIDTIGRVQKMSFVNESGIYALIFQSRKKEAKEFKKWVFNEVLPQIRKTGKFEIQPQQLTRLEILQIAIESEKKVLELQDTVSTQQSTIEIQDKTIFDISNIQETYSLREASKNLVVREKTLQEYIKSKKWWIYLSDGAGLKKMYSTSYAKQSSFAIDKLVLNKTRQKFYHQFRITKHGMDFLIKKRQEIAK